ncbi:hypothetical protein DM02DRAFT_4532 [Periconia macrospinosa]|uniref:Uncharacterized protein n=1 Tax=Periconia macrospinosa TaxID=97972 RepID=A0A2V1EG63_9PLEO|nr:hypothetical protein DM02DRAFT_4532 [Periconia macrospinosa]
MVKILVSMSLPFISATHSDPRVVFAPRWWSAFWTDLPFTLEARPGKHGTERGTRQGRAEMAVCFRQSKHAGVKISRTQTRPTTRTLSLYTAFTPQQLFLYILILILQ